jgi:ABC-type antimicrobial peptide transport system permease subunit
MMGLACYLLLAYPLQLPLWGLFLAVVIALIFLVPCGIIAAVTNAALGLNVITEFVAGYLLPSVFFLVFTNCRE